MRSFLASALLLASAAAPAFAASPVHHFSQDGDRYAYTADRQADGSITLSGRVETTGDNFALRVTNGRVNGRVGASNVSFAVSHKLMAQLDTEVPAYAEAGAANESLAAN
jgi:hypothetical protein